jgi:hypothetical protein
LEPEEKEMMKMVKTDWLIEMTIGMMKWRRYKIWDKGDLFFQEYPEDDVSCFLQTGRSVFSKITTRKELRIPLDNLNSWNASDEEKKALRKRRLYAGLDGAEGTPTGDAHSFAVIDVVDGKGIVIYEHTSNEPIEVFDLKVKRICQNFNILLGVEKNGVGVAHCQRLKQEGINFIKWETTGANRPIMVADLEEAYRKGDLIETYPEAENEARDMEYGNGNRAEHKSGKHDDRVFARMLAWQMLKMPTPSLTFA